MFKEGKLLELENKNKLLNSQLDKEIATVKAYEAKFRFDDFTFSYQLEKKKCNVKRNIINLVSIKMYSFN